jgi:hypothetical protein
MCRAKNGELLTSKNQVLAKWKEHFEENLNEGYELEQPTGPVDLRDDGVDFDLPSHKEIEEALKYQKYQIKQEDRRRGFYRGRTVKKKFNGGRLTVDLIWWMHYMQ